MDNYFARFYTHSYNMCREIHFSILLDINFKLMGFEMKVKGTRFWCALEENVRDNYYARFFTHSYQRCRETLFLSILLEVKF